MTIAENVWIGREPTRLGLVNHAELNRRTKALFDRIGIDLDPQRELGTLTVANQQMVEIAKAVSYDSDILIMDEPTSAITDKEVEHLFAIIAELKRQSKSIVYITPQDGRGVPHRRRPLGVPRRQASSRPGRPPSSTARS